MKVVCEKQTTQVTVIRVGNDDVVHHPGYDQFRDRNPRCPLGYSSSGWDGHFEPVGIHGGCHVPGIAGGYPAPRSAPDSGRGGIA